MSGLNLSLRFFRIIEIEIYIDGPGNKRRPGIDLKKRVFMATTFK